MEWVCLGPHLDWQLGGGTGALLSRSDLCPVGVPNVLWHSGRSSQGDVSWEEYLWRTPGSSGDLDFEVLLWTQEIFSLECSTPEEISRA